MFERVLCDYSHSDKGLDIEFCNPLLSRDQTRRMMSKPRLTIVFHSRAFVISV